jgi:hypothetical protein
MKPLLDVVEGLDISDIIDYDDSMCSSIIGRSDSPKSLLSCSVPDL